MRRNALRRAGNVCLLTAALGLTVPATAGAAAAGQPDRTVRTAAAALPQVRTVSRSLSGLVAGPSENINLTGTIDITVITLPATAGGGTAQIISSLDDTTGTGATSGRKYLFVGAHRDNVTFASGATTTIDVTPNFLLVSPVVPPNPVVPPQQIKPVRVSVTVTSAGVIDSILAVPVAPTT
ncbi:MULTISPECIES: hypothetical protein [unclassified Streptomyces]|uniref:hypothetical protein n=1 Tax=unclassified Streptomyces TaxID=2593676 RepID=UPI003422858C